MTTQGRFIAIETVAHMPQQIQHAFQRDIHRSDVHIVTTPSPGDLGRLQAERASDQPNWLERIYGGLADLHDFVECEGGILSRIEHGQHVICIGYRLSLGAANLPGDDQLGWYQVTSQQLLAPDVSLIVGDGRVDGDHASSLRLRRMVESDSQAVIIETISDDWRPLIDKITALLPTDGGAN